jgi:DNA-binding CsgD family transcriptional regulator
MTARNVICLSRTTPAAHATVDDRQALSKREYDVLHCLALGKSGHETGLILGISVCTVRVHIRGLKQKLNASNIPHAITAAFQAGLLPLEWNSQTLESRNSDFAASQSTRAKPA